VNGVHTRPGWLGFPVCAKFAQAAAMRPASACGSGPSLVPCEQRAVLSKQKASSAVCHAPASSSIGDCQVKYHVKTGAPCCACFIVAMRVTLLRIPRPFSPNPLHM
jgi:hypothetical protein